MIAGAPEEFLPNRLSRATICDAQGQPLDDALVVCFAAPHSYTGEEVVEIQCHGGLALARAVETARRAAAPRR